MNSYQRRSKLNLIMNQGKVVYTCMLPLSIHCTPVIMFHITVCCSLQQQAARAVNNMKNFNKRQNPYNCWGLELSSLAVCWLKHPLNVTLIYFVVSELSCVSVVLSYLEVGDMDKIMQSSQKANLKVLSAFLALIFMPVTRFSPLWMFSFEKEA